MGRQRRIDLTGRKYGNWLVKEYIGNSKHRAPQYLCVCGCGKEKILTSSGERLPSFSCGCQNPGRWAKGTFANTVDRFATLRARYKRDAKTRGYCFNLTNSEFDEIIQGVCYYCGSQKQSSQMYNFRELVEYTGIDRVDNSIGYVKENCVPCCSICNSLKKAVSKEIIEKAYNFLFGKKDG